MTTVIERPETEVPEDEEQERRLLRRVLIGLGVVAVLLILILLWLLRGQLPGVAGKEGREGYPIDVVAVLYGYGPNPEQQFRFPLGVALDEKGHAWVSDTEHSRVVVLTQKGKLVRLIGAPDPGASTATDDRGRLSSPYGIALDEERERAYVADWTSGAVMIYSTKNGRYLERLPAPEQDMSIFGPNGFTPFDVRVVGKQVVATSNDGLYFFDRDGMVITRWGSQRGRASAQFNFPDAFDVDAKTGTYYVADTLNRRVLAIGRDGKVLWVSGTPDQSGKIVSFWQLPRSVTVGPKGNVYVVDTFRPDEKGVGGGHIVVLSPKGEVLSLFGRQGDEDDSFRFPEKMATGPDGLWAIADREHNRVIVFRLRGELPAPLPKEREAFPDSFVRPEDLTVAPDETPTGD